MLDDDVKWFISTCHPCQTRQTRHLHLPPTIPDIPTVFRKVHIDTMLMPTVNKFCYLVQARCTLSSWPEWRPLWKENEKTLGDFIFRISFADGVEWLKLLLIMAPHLWLWRVTCPRNMASITSRSPLITLRPMVLWNGNTLTYANHS